MDGMETNDDRPPGRVGTGGVEMKESRWTGWKRPKNPMSIPMDWAVTPVEMKESRWTGWKRHYALVQAASTKNPVLRGLVEMKESRWTGWKQAALVERPP